VLLCRSRPGFCGGRDAGGVKCVTVAVVPCCRV
jgi:hypothetical protein